MSNKMRIISENWKKKWPIKVETHGIIISWSTPSAYYDEKNRVSFLLILKFTGKGEILRRNENFNAIDDKSDVFQYSYLTICSIISFMVIRRYQTITLPYFRAWCGFLAYVFRVNIPFVSQKSKIEWIKRNL